MEPGGSLNRFQEPATGPHPMSHESITQLHNILPQDASQYCLTIRLVLPSGRFPPQQPISSSLITLIIFGKV